MTTRRAFITGLVSWATGNLTYRQAFVALAIEYYVLGFIGGATLVWMATR